jgi:hypothetical protein
MDPKSAHNLFTRVGATFVSIVCLSMYLRSLWVRLDQQLSVGIGRRPVTEKSELQVVVR